VTRAGSVHENELLPETTTELRWLGLRPREAVIDAGLGARANKDELAELGTNVFVVGSASNRGSRRTRRRLARYRVGAEGRIAHLKRAYYAGRARLRYAEGVATWQN
jgi:hypothetical protein